VGVAGGDTVVDLGECDPDIDVLGPEHRLLVRGEWAHGGVTAGERVQDHHGGVEVDHHLLVGGDAVPSAYTSRSARALDPGRAGEPREGAAERQPGRRGDQVEPVDPEVRVGHGAEPAGCDLQPDRLAGVVLRTGEDQLGDAVPGTPGGLEVLLADLSIS
jgi:hypothetical protein